MNLIEFPDDKLAFDSSKVSAIRGKSEVDFRNPTCDASCLYRAEPKYGSYCQNEDHNRMVEFTVIRVDSVEYTVRRPFHDVMLAISAHLLDNQSDTA